MGRGTLLSVTKQENHTKSEYQVVCGGVAEVLRHLNFKKGCLLEQNDSFIAQHSSAKVCFR